MTGHDSPLLCVRRATISFMDRRVCLLCIRQSDNCVLCLLHATAIHFVSTLLRNSDSQSTRIVSTKLPMSRSYASTLYPQALKVSVRPFLHFHCRASSAFANISTSFRSISTCGAALGAGTIPSIFEWYSTSPAWKPTVAVHGMT